MSMTLPVDVLALATLGVMKWSGLFIIVLHRGNSAICFIALGPKFSNRITRLTPLVSLSLSKCI
jgi:hypothetical protein